MSAHSLLSENFRHTEEQNKDVSMENSKGSFLLSSLVMKIDCNMG